jgi:hypothetical protein
MANYIDSETCGLVGPMVLLQYAEDDGPVTLHEVWRTPARRTLDLIERLADGHVIGFNLVFDWFHVQKIQNMLACLPKRKLSRQPQVKDMADVERRAPLFGDCVKPRAALDVYLHLITGPFQSLMERKPIRIRKVPEMIAQELVVELQGALQFDWIYTHKKKEGPAWKVKPSKDAPGFVDISFSFGASRTLKSIHRYTMGSDPILFPMPDEMYPVETQWSPYHDGRPGTWPDRIKEHVRYWSKNQLARQYGQDDVTMVRDLHRKFGGEPGDMESTLACMIGSVRYRGFPIDIDAAQKELAKSREQELSAGPLDWRPVLAKLHELCDDPLEVSIITSTKDEALEPLVKWVGADGPHPVAVYAASVREARKHRFRAQWLQKLVQAGRFHPSLSPVGTLTRRASGSGGFNPQNIDKEHETRALFVFSDTPETFRQYEQFLGTKLGDPEAVGKWRGCVGDFDSFETVIAIATWQDELLRHYIDKDIKPYHVFGSYLYRRALGGGCAKKALTEIRKEENYVQYASRAKNSWYGLMYGAQEFKISQTAGVPIEHVAEALRDMGEECVGMARGRQKVFDDLSCVLQEHEGRGFHWRQPNPRIANILGWERDFSFEVEIIKALFHMRLPSDWRDIDIKVVRSNREQTVYGATCSAMLGAVKQMEARMKRQAGNSIMQSGGAMYCKDLEVRQWDDAQPCGVHPWNIAVLNVHDELGGALRDGVSVAKVTEQALKDYSEKVPLVKLGWQEDGVHSWADKE